MSEGYPAVPRNQTIVRSRVGIRVWARVRGTVWRSAGTPVRVRTRAAQDGGRRALSWIGSCAADPHGTSPPVFRRKLSVAAAGLICMTTRTHTAPGRPASPRVSAELAISNRCPIMKLEQVFDPGSMNRLYRSKPDHSRWVRAHAHAEGANMNNAHGTVIDDRPSGEARSAGMSGLDELGVGQARAPHLGARSRAIQPRPDLRRPVARPVQPAYPGSESLSGGPSLIRIDLRSATPFVCSGLTTGAHGIHPTDVVLGDAVAPSAAARGIASPSAFIPANPRTPAGMSDVGAGSGAGVHSAMVRSRVGGAVPSSGPSSAASGSHAGTRTSTPIASTTRCSATATGWHLTTRGLAVVLAGFLLMMVLGASAVIHSFASITSADSHVPQHAVRVDAANSDGQHSMGSTEVPQHREAVVRLNR